MDSYRDILEKELTSRTQRNSTYSLRAFARDLGLTPGQLSKILKKKIGLSSASAKKIAKRLGLTDDETIFFCDSVASQHERNKKKREDAYIRLLHYKESGQYKFVSLDDFSIVSDWYHYAILSLLELKKINGEPHLISQYLKIPINIVLSALQRLEDVGLVTKKGENYFATENYTATSTDIPSAAIKNHHNQILELSKKSLNITHIHARDFSSLFLTIDSNELPVIKKRIKEFRRSLDAEFGSKKNKNTVYNLAVQFYSLENIGLTK